MIEPPKFPTRASESYWSEAWRRYRRNLPAMIGLGILLVLLILSLAAPLITPYDPVKQRIIDSLEFPSLEHPFGTDYLGRDLLARMLYGGRISLLIGFLAVGLGVIVAVPLGAISGYYGGWVDLLIQRIADVLISFPSFLLALTLAGLLGVGLRNVVIAVGVLAIPSILRVVRSSVLTIRSQPYIEAAHCIGVPNSRIIFKHILPNALAPVIVLASLNLGYAISTAAGLGFLGFGVQPPTPEWGMMLGEGKNYIFSHPFMVTYPGVVIFLAIIAFNLLGDGLRDALDPRLKNVG